MPEELDASAARLLALEQRVAQVAGAVFDSAFKRLLAFLVVLWPGDDADPLSKQAALSRLDLTTMLASVNAAQRGVAEGVIESLALGLEEGLDQAGVGGVGVDTVFKRDVPDEIAEEIATLPQRARAHVARATEVLRAAETLADAQAALALANPATPAKQLARSTTNKASNIGLERVAAESEELIAVWRAEQDGCVHCMAYQGHRQRKGVYPKGLTFAAKPLKAEVVKRPPLHPNCRCTQWILHKDVAPAVQAGLKREAQRSILKGWSVSSESEKVRLDAARRLLADHPAMPKSVQAYARSAVKNGAFARGRDVPGAR